MKIPHAVLFSWEIKIFTLVIQLGIEDLGVRLLHYCLLYMADSAFQSLLFPLTSLALPLTLEI